VDNEKVIDAKESGDIVFKYKMHHIHASRLVSIARALRHFLEDQISSFRDTERERRAIRRDESVCLAIDPGKDTAGVTIHERCSGCRGIDSSLISILSGLFDRRARSKQLSSCSVKKLGEVKRNCVSTNSSFAQVHPRKAMNSHIFSGQQVQFSTGLHGSISVIRNTVIICLRRIEQEEVDRW
jgi:hypothetical protein